jgi:translation initiation factor 6
MTVRRMDVNRIPYLGAFAFCTDNVAVFPRMFHFKETIAGVLGVPLLRLNVSGSPLVGILVAGNSNRLICSDIFEVDKSDGLQVDYTPGNFTAFGNMVLANDRGAVVSPELSGTVVEAISEGMGVPVEKGTIAGFKTVGAVGVATNRGALIHPDVTEVEIKQVERVLDVPVDVGTACGGVKFVGLCVVANSKGALAGTTTTGPELGRIESSLGFV